MTTMRPATQMTTHQIVISKTVIFITKQVLQWIQQHCGSKKWDGEKVAIFRQLQISYGIW